MSEIECSECKRLFLPKRKSGTRGDRCNSCVVKRYRRKTKEKAVAYKGGKCLLCGYLKCMRALEFHHLDPKEKEIKISDNTTHTWEKLVKELDKCVLLCSNCHVEVHAGIATLSI